MDPDHIPKKLDAPPPENGADKKPSKSKSVSKSRSKDDNTVTSNSSLKKSKSKLLFFKTGSKGNSLTAQPKAPAVATSATTQAQPAAQASGPASPPPIVAPSPHLLEVQEVVPDLLDTIPSEVVEVVFKQGIEVSFGNELTPEQVKDMPNRLAWPHEPGALYTLTLLDLDSPSRQTPKYREWNHWLVYNIPENDVKSGKTLYEYISSCPPKGTGFHRYVFLVFKQSGPLEPDEKVRTNTSGEGRGNFKIKEFAQKYKLGDPIACNFYVAQFDEFVTKLYEKISGD